MPGRFLTQGIYSFVNCQIVCSVHYRFLFNMTLFCFFIAWHLITVRTFSVWCLPASEHLVFGTCLFQMVLVSFKTQSIWYLSVFGTCLFQNTKYLVPASFKTQSIWYLSLSKHRVFGTCLFQNTKYLVLVSFKTQSIWYLSLSKHKVFGTCPFQNTKYLVPASLGHLVFGACCLQNTFCLMPASIRTFGFW